MVDMVCLTAVRGISDLVMVPGLINVDFADVRSIMTGMGRALMGSGRGTGERRALDAAQMAITSPLLEDVSIDGATGILVNISGGPDLTLSEVTEACTLVHEAADPDANIIFGSVIDSNLRDEVRITVIATGFQSRNAVEASTNTRSVMIKRPLENQMTLPIGSGSKHPNDIGSGSVPNLVSSPALPAPAPIVETRSQPLPTFTLEAERVPSPHVTTIVGTPVSAPLEAVDTSVDEHEPEPAYPPLSYLATPSPMVAQGIPPQTMMPAYPSDSRPVIRPAVQSMVAVSASARRPTVSAPMTPDALGIEENEFDKPTYLRRALATETSHGFRSPGDHGGKV
jgi:hypothetical protein